MTTSNHSEIAHVSGVHVIVLAGSLRRSELSEATGVHALCLPFGERGSLLDSWLYVINEIPSVRQVTICLNDAQDQELVEQEIERSHLSSVIAAPVQAMPEPGAWRGAGGVVKDMTRDVPAGEMILVIESQCQPPKCVRTVLEEFDSKTVGRVGITDAMEPCGVYMFAQSAIELIPATGYFDIKEQLLPALFSDGLRVDTKALSPRVQRLRDRRSYLTALRSSLGSHEQRRAVARIDPDAVVENGARVAGATVIGEGAIVRKGAIVHDSVVMARATVAADAVVSRSIVGINARVRTGQRVVRTCVESTGPVFESHAPEQLRGVSAA